MKVEIYIALNSEMSTTIQSENTLINYTKSDILKKLVLLPVDWGKNSLLFAKQLHVMNKITGY